MAVVARKRPHLGLANCLPGDGVGALVYITGDRVGKYYQVATADPSDRAKMPAVGMIVQKVDATACVVQFEGSVEGVYSSLTPGELLFTGDGGGLDDEMPTAAANYVQPVGASLGSDVFRLEPNMMMTRRRA
jgi:hypothetical protein